MSEPQQLIIPGDCRAIPFDYIESFDCLITDPPYSPKVHSSAVSVTGSGGKLYNTRKREFGFDHLDPELRDWVGQAAAKVKRWSVIYSDIESTHLLREACSGATYIRTVAWIRWSMPQLSGDRPPSGREDLCIFHRTVTADDSLDVCFSEDPVMDVALFYGTKKGKKAWNGPGNLTHLEHKCLRGEGKHRAEKPLDQALDLVDWFSDPGEVIFDPFAGSGTLALACAILGRNYVGVEKNPEWVEKSGVRLDNFRRLKELSDRDQDRLGRWLASRKAA